MSALKLAVPPVFIRTAYNYDRDAESDASALVCPEPTRAQQQFRDECDINTLVRRFGVTGKIPVSPLPPKYGDFTGVNDFHTAVNSIAAANEAFDALPAAVRSRFHNDPGEFVEFVTTASNRAELEKMGLLVPPPQPAPTERFTATPEGLKGVPVDAPSDSNPDAVKAA